LAIRSWRNRDFLSASAKALRRADGRKGDGFRRFFAPVFASSAKPNSWIRSTKSALFARLPHIRLFLTVALS
jgi:hypothetical protein